MQPTTTAAASSKACPRAGWQHAARCAGVSLALAAATAAHAQRNEIYYQLTNANPLTVLTNPAGFQSVTGPSVGWVYDGTGPQGQGHSNGLTGTVTLGAQSSTGSAKVLATGNGAGYSAFVQGSWDDDITFSGGPAGTRGTVSFKMGWDWTPSFSVGAGGSGQANPYIDLFLKHVGPRDRTADQYAAVHQDFSRSCTAALQCTNTDSGISIGASAGTSASQLYPTPRVTWAGQVATFQFVVEFGRTYNLMAAIGTSVSGSGAVTTLDATHSLSWQGISSVVNAQGQAVAYNVTSASGFNYVTPVPEPQQSALLSTGLAMLLLAARRARRAGRAGAAGAERRVG